MSIMLNDGPRSFDPSVDINPGSVEAFLRMHGWVQEDVREGISSIWANPEDDASVLLPYNRRYRDYSLRLREALEVIADVQRVPYGEELGLEIASAVSDILFVRADQVTPDGSIPLSEAQNLLNGVGGLIAAAAWSSVRPRPTQKGRQPNAVKEFVADDVRMGHTRRGSFVLTIYARHRGLPISLSPLETDSLALRPEDSPTNVDELELSFTRHVMTTLASGLNATRELFEASIDVDDAVELGVSDKLLGSMKLMSSYEGIRALDLSFRWSPGQSRHEPDVPSRVVVPRVDPRQIDEITKVLRKRPQVEHDSVVGQVIRLERAELEEAGIVVVDGFVGRTRRKVRVSLSGEAYRTAIHAHETRSPVVAEGDVTLEGRMWWLRGNPTLRLVLDGDRPSVES